MYEGNYPLCNLLQFSPVCYLSFEYVHGIFFFFAVQKIFSFMS